LLWYTAEAALAARRLTQVILSTEDEEIAEVGRTCGLEVPFLRPAALACDDTPSLAVIQHTVGWMEERGRQFDAICLLQPTTPLRRPGEIDACIDLLERADADTVMTVLPVPADYNPHWVYFENDAGFLRLSTGEAVPIPRRQELPPAFHREGSIYVTRRAVLDENTLYGRRLLGYPLDPQFCVNINTPADWARAESLLKDRWQPILQPSHND
jgi:CMP-N-acetylneuraminic acid synthetase